MPAVKPRMREIVFFGNRVLVEFLVVGVHELDVGKAFVLRHYTITNDLYFWLVWDGLEIRVQDTTFSVQSLAVAIANGGRVEAVGQLILGFG